MENIENKTCLKCKVEQPKTEFHKNSAKPDGLNHICKKCKSDQGQKYYEENSEEIIQRTVAWGKAHRPQTRVYTQNWRKNNIELAMVKSARQRAQKDSTLFKIGIEDIKNIWPMDNLCPVFKTELKPSDTGRVGSTSPTLDKIIPSLGYVPGNIAVISMKANLIKQDVTDPEDLRKVADWLESQLNKDSSSQLK